MQNDKIVTVMTLSGEYVGVLIEDKGNAVVLRDPKLVTNGENGLALADGISATGEVPSEVTLHNVTFTVPSHPDVVTAHMAAVGESDAVN